jgi:hypothetical protein
MTKGCDECGVSGGYALYCVGCYEKFFGNKKWVGLTDEEIDTLFASDVDFRDVHVFSKTIEAKLKEKNK